MGDPPLELRPTREEDLPSLSALFEQRFGHTLQPEEWRWKYGQFAEHGVGESRSLVAVAPDGEVAAHAGALCFHSRWSGGEAGAWQLVDFAGTTARRGLRSAFVELGRLLLADLPRPHDAPFLFGFPSERHFRLGMRVFGYLPLTEIEILKGELPQVEPNGAGIGTSDQACAEFGEVWDACGALGVRRSVPFLDWRYYARPGRYYRFYRLEAHPRAALTAPGGASEGFAVFAFAGEEARAAELWLPGADRDVDWMPALLAIASDLRELGLRSWRFWGPAQAALRPLLATLGLRPSGERQFVGCRGAVGGPDPRRAAHAFTYTMGDFDLT